MVIVKMVLLNRYHFPRKGIECEQKEIECDLLDILECRYREYGYFVRYILEFFLMDDLVETREEEIEEMITEQ